MKTHDLCVVTRTYTNKDGEEKANWQNVGVVMKGDKGSYILLDRTFNPAGVPNPENRDTVMVKMFPAKPKHNDQTQSFIDSQKQADDQLNDEIPF